MKRYIKKYEQLIYQYNQKLLEQELLNSISNYACIGLQDKTIINQKAYFDQISIQLQQYIYKFLLDMKNAKNFSEYIDIKDIVEFLLKAKIKNYKNFNSFLNQMKLAQGQIEIRISNDVCYYQYPINIVKNQIKIFDEQINPFYVLEITQKYQQYIKAKTKYVSTLDQAYKQLKDIAIYQDSWGILNFNVNYFSNEQELKIAIDHQVGHLIRFLIRVSGINHNFCMYWSKIPHNKFDNNKINYYLDQQQFKAISSTYIQRLVNAFKNNSNDFSKQNIEDYYKTVLYLSNVLKYSPVNVKNIEIFVNIFSNIDITAFINVIYKDSLSNFKGQNKFKVFKKWLYNSLKKLIK